MESRYRIPILVPLFPLAAVGLLQLKTFWEQKEKRSFVISIIAILSIILLSSLPGPFTREISNYRSEYYFAIGDTSEKQGRINDAIIAYEKSVEINDYPDAHYSLAILLRDNKKVEASFPHFLKAIKVFPNSWRIHYNLGKAYSNIGQLNNAEKSYTHAIALDPTQGSIYNDYGKVMFSRKNYNKALELTLKAVKLAPHDPLIVGNLGAIYASRGQLAKAEVHFREALEMKSDLINMRVNLGLCLRQQGKTQEAISQFRRVLEMNPNHPVARRELQKLLK